MGVGGGGRLLAVLEPSVHIAEEGAEEEAVVVGIGGVAGDGGGEGEAAGAVLGSGEEIDAGVGGERGVGGAVGSDVDEGGGAAPVFIRAVGVEDFGDDGGGGGAVEQAGAGAGDGVGFGEIGEGEDVDGVEEIEEGACVAGGLGEAVVEVAAAGAGDVGPEAVEDDAAALVGVEAFIEEVAEEAAALADAVADGAMEGGGGIAERGGRAAVFEEGDEIANGGGAEANDGRVGGGVEDLVDEAGFEAALEGDGGAVGGEAPAVARDEAARIFDVGADGELGGGIDDGGVGLVAHVAEGGFGFGAIGNEVAADLAAEGGAIGIFCDG